MSFMFNFEHGDGAIDGDLRSSPKDDTSDSDVIQCCPKDCGFLSLNNEHLKNTSEDISLLKFENLEVQYILLDSAEIKTEDEVFSQISALQTDRVPGKYEGGLKIWECSVDLANYLVENNYIKDGQAVLELGCGAGLPGIVAYLKGALVTFQDFNPEVLEYFTLPNTVLNTDKDMLSNLPKVCHYLYGDWGDIQSKYYSNSTDAKKYDIILTSETIYEKSNQKKLLDLMKSALKPDGTIYLASKIHYFGVGGGIVEFESLVNADKNFEIVSIHRITEGVERQILVMKFR